MFHNPGGVHLRDSVAPGRQGFNPQCHRLFNPRFAGQGRDADDAALKKAYRMTALRLHPDKCQLPGSKEAFQKLGSAYSCLSDPDDRAYYDRTGREKGAASTSSGARPLVEQP